MTFSAEQPGSDIPHGLLQPDEEIEARAYADDGVVVVTDRRLAIAIRADRFALDIPYERLRRIQFDIEKTRPATLVIVPELPSDPPMVLAIPPQQFEAVAQVLSTVGRRLFEVAHLDAQEPSRGV